jgi:hypothetical protein
MLIQLEDVPIAMLSIAIGPVLPRQPASGRVAALTASTNVMLYHLCPLMEHPRQTQARTTTKLAQGRILPEKALPPKL